MRLRLLIAEAWRSLAANISTTFAATMTVLVGMFILGLFIALGTWTVSWSNHVKHELVVKVDFKTSGQKGGPATRAQENAVARMLQSNQQIRKSTFVSKAVAFKRMQKLHPELTSDLPWNPLPDSFQITPVKAEYIHEIAQSLRPAPPLQRLLHHGPFADFAGDRQLLVVDHAVASAKPDCRLLQEIQRVMQAGLHT